MSPRSKSLLIAVLATAFLAVVVNAGSPRGPVPGQYIISFRPDMVHTMKSDLISKFEAASPYNQPITTFNMGSFQGFVAKSTPAYIDYLRTHQLIAHIEPDMYVHSNGKGKMGEEDPICLIQRNATWGLNRVSERKIDLDHTYHYDHDGEDVDVYIVDTGISVTHSEFTNGSVSRAVWGMNFADNDDRDCNGHGTHVAGTIGSRSYGLAKNATLIAVKVLDCDGSGTNSGVIKGMEWVVRRRKATGRPSIVNMSLGGSFSTMVNQAVTSLHAAGVVVVVAAGNENEDACIGSPSSSPQAITVGATTVDSAWDGAQYDHRSYFSNYGSCVDIFAPGTGITSTWIGSNTANKTISGTSMASPHVAGAAALYLSINPTADPEQVRAYLTTEATADSIELSCKDTSCKKSPNKLLFSSC